MEKDVLLFVMTRTELKYRIVDQHLRLTHTITLALNTVHKPEPHPNIYPPLRPLGRSYV